MEMSGPSPEDVEFKCKLLAIQRNEFIGKSIFPRAIDQGRFLIDLIRRSISITQGDGNSIRFSLREYRYGSGRRNLEVRRQSCLVNGNDVVKYGGQASYSLRKRQLHEKLGRGGCEIHGLQ